MCCAMDDDDGASAGAVLWVVACREIRRYGAWGGRRMRRWGRGQAVHAVPAHALFDAAAIECGDGWARAGTVCACVDECGG